MESFESDVWISFVFVFAVALLIAFIMRLLSTFFYTKDVTIRKFNILDLEIAASPQELANLINGLYQLPVAYSRKAIISLKARLYLDFLFMPFVYGSIMLLCLRINLKAHTAIGKNIFETLAELLLVSWLCDIIENVYLLRKIKPNVVPSSKMVHRLYLFMEAVKWGIIFIAVISCFAFIAYYWVTGKFTSGSVEMFYIILIEIIIFLTIGKFVKIKPPYSENKHIWEK